MTAALQTGSSGQQHLYPSHFSAITVPMRRNAKGDPDFGWQEEIVRLAEARNAALTAARHTAEQLDATFLDYAGVPVDLSILPI